MSGCAFVFLYNRLRYLYFSKFLPKFTLQKLQLGDVYICALNESDNKRGGVFASRSCGASRTWEIAVLKAQAEYVEREAVRAANAASSTGFAAFPFIFFKQRAIKQAKKYAYAEMVERYAWPEWFANNTIAYQLRSDVCDRNNSFYQAIQKEIEFSNLYIIQPQLELNDLQLVIIYAVSELGLVCAAAAHKNIEQAELSALKELYMHAIGLFRMKSQNLEATTIYDKRVYWISGQHECLQKRLSSQGNVPLSIPFSVIFQDIKTAFDQTHVVQRCVFEGYQKKFISEENEMYI